MRKTKLALISMASCLIAAVSESPGMPANFGLFSLGKADNIMAEGHFGIKSEKVTVGVPHTASILKLDGLWAPPFVSSDFSLDATLGGTAIVSDDYTWYPIEMVRTGSRPNLQLSSSVLLVPGQRSLLITLDVRNTGGQNFSAPLVVTVSGTLDSSAKSSNYQFTRTQSSSATAISVAGPILKLSKDTNCIAIGSNDLAWSGNTGRATLSVPASGRTILYISAAVGTASDATAKSQALIANPVTSADAARNAYSGKIDLLYQSLPKFQSDNSQLKRFYDRSVMHLLLNKWEVDEFLLNPYYSTGGVLGGTLGEYLWNFGEPWEILPLADPAALKAHIKQFLKIDLTSSFGFSAIVPQGTPAADAKFGLWYPINQEKIIGLIYNYIKYTGDKAFLDEVVDSRTVMDHVKIHADFVPAGPQPSPMLDYGSSNSHLELRKNGYPDLYNHVMPDLNGRRYESFIRASEIAAWHQEPSESVGFASDAQSIVAPFKQTLWNPGKTWFEYIHDGIKEARYTVQMFYLLGSGVLDADEELGLLNHLNDREFLSDYGLHSLSKTDTAYDDLDVDNGGPGSCTAFPVHIAERLYKMGMYGKAENLLKRLLWWEKNVPYWGDSFLADRLDYRRDTPLLGTIDAITGAQAIIFGMFGIESDIDGIVKVNPHPPSFSSSLSLTGVTIRGTKFDVIVTGKTYVVKCNGKSVQANVGFPVSIVSGNPVAGAARPNALVEAGVFSDRLAITSTAAMFDGVDQIFAYTGGMIYWHDGTTVNRGTVVNGVLQHDLSFKCSSFAAADRLFAASGNTVYWQSGNQLRRGTITNGNLVIDAGFSFNGFTASDTLFAANGNTVYWQSVNQLRRGTVTNGILSPDATFKYDGFTRSDRLFAASGSTVYWQTASNQIRRAAVGSGTLSPDAGYVINDFDPKGICFATDNGLIYWHSGYLVHSGAPSQDKLVLTKIYKGFTSQDSLFAMSGSTAYWQSGNQVRRGTITNGGLSIDASFSFNGFNASTDRLFAASGNTLYWQSGIQLRRGTINNGSLSVDAAFSFNGFNAATDRLFAALRDTVYWQSGNQVRRGTVTNGSLSVDSPFSYNGFNGAVDRLFAASGTTVYWQAGNQLRRGTIANGALTIDPSFSSDGSAPNERVFAASGATVVWQSR